MVLNSTKVDSTKSHGVSVSCSFCDPPSGLSEDRATSFFWS